jgi:arylamine N-acetyltransferase
VVEIIRKGELPQEKWYEYTCQNCHTRFKFRQKEAKLHDDQREGSWWSINCPLSGCNQACNIARLQPYQEPKRDLNHDLNRDMNGGWYPGR